MVTSLNNATAVVLSAKLPMKCIMSTICPDNSTKLLYNNWQKPLLEGLLAPHNRIWIMQDDEETDIWNNGFGCGHDDILVYDRFGRLFEYFPSVKTGQDEFSKEQDLITAEGYQNVMQSIVRATHVSVHECPIASSSHGGDGNSVMQIILITLAAGFICHVITGLSYVVYSYFKNKREKYSHISAEQVADLESMMYDDDDDWDVTVNLNGNDRL
jgi:hypothetical protein